MKYSSQSKEEKIVSLDRSLKQITAERDKLKKEYTELENSLGWENRQLKSEIETSKNNLLIRNNENAKLQKDLDEMNKKLNWIRKQKAEGDAEIQKLTNQVNLLKKELKL